MKRLILVLALLMTLALGIQAQDVEFVEFSNELYGVQGLVPANWESRGFGGYARAESDSDLAAIFIQSAPLAAETLLNALKTQLGVNEIPEPDSQIEGELLWDVRSMTSTIQGLDLSFSVATTEVDG